jgi:hypothetical protein
MAREVSDCARLIERGSNQEWVSDDVLEAHRDM